MAEIMPDKGGPISPDMTVLDVVSRHRQTETVFKKYEEQAGACICCEALFEPLKAVAEKYGLDLEQVLTELESAASDERGGRNHAGEKNDAHIAVDSKKGQIDPLKLPS
jgi:chaperonin GroEL (HSP60 family)